jgi:cytochrome b561
LQQPTHRYTSVAIILHWLIAACILFNLSVGFFMEGFAPPARGVWVGLHISSGVSVLALSVVRLAWRIGHTPPEFPLSMPALERNAAMAVHTLLYVGMFVIPLTGFMFLSAHHPRPGMGIRVWGLFTLPPIDAIAQLSDPAQKAFHDRWVHYHSLAAWLMIWLLLLHVAGAIKHQIMDGENSFARMGIGRSR